MQGFRPAEQRNVVVNADLTSRVDLRLEIGSIEEGVVVTAEAPLLDTTIQRGRLIEFGGSIEF